MRVLAVDPGKRRVGLALSDPLGVLASPLLTLQVKPRDDVAELLAEIAREHQVERILVGFPKNMDGSVGPAAKAAQRLARSLAEKVSLTVELVDERLSSQQARRALRESGVSVKKGKPKLDQMAAVVILQAYLDSAREAPP